VFAKEAVMAIDLTTRYGRLKLTTPLIVGACPMTGDEQARAAMESAGAGAIVLPSLFQEQVILWNEKQGQSLTPAEQRVLARAKHSHVDAFCDDADTYLSIVNRASSLSSIPIIASLNGEVGGNWLDFAGELQEAGAEAIELNIHIPPPRDFEGPRDVENKIVELVATIGQSITVPLYVKLGNEFTSLGHLAARLASGAQGLVLFSRSPDVDFSLDNLQIKTKWGLTQPGSVTQCLSAVMKVHAFCPMMPLAVSGGIGNASDYIKVLLAGADVGMITSTIYREGPHAIRALLDGLLLYMEKRQWTSMAELQAHRPLEFDSEDLRLDYVKALAARPEMEPGSVEKVPSHRNR
jgi:dihydroorotate dehydrogenase (fumarate)